MKIEEMADFCPWRHFPPLKTQHPPALHTMEMTAKRRYSGQGRGVFFMNQTMSQAEASDALEQGLQLLCQSQAMLRTLFLGIALQYRSLDVQRQELLLQAEDPAASLSGPGPLELQNAASLIVLCALFGFQKQAEELANQAAQAGDCPDLLSVKLGATSILIALIRLARLNLGSSRSSQAELNSLEEAGDPADLSL